MISVVFVCLLGDVKKEIKVEDLEVKSGEVCQVFIDGKVVGNAKHDEKFCDELAIKIKKDMERKGYVCGEPVENDQKRRANQAGK